MTRAQSHNQESKVRPIGDEMVMRRSDFFFFLTDPKWKEHF